MAEDEMMYTRRELRIGQQSAFIAGANWILGGIRAPDITVDAVKDEASRRFPLPTKPRVVRDGEGFSWKVVERRIYLRYDGDSGKCVTEWRDAKDSLIPISPARVEMLMDLLKHPNEDA